MASVRQKPWPGVIEFLSRRIEVGELDKLPPRRWDTMQYAVKAREDNQPVLVPRKIRLTFFGRTRPLVVVNATKPPLGIKCFLDSAFANLAAIDTFLRAHVPSGPNAKIF